MDERGFKPVETEVPVQGGWVADLAGVLCPTQTELIGLKLLRRRPEWKASEATHENWKAEYDGVNRMLTAVVEVKASRADFRGDKKWSTESPADLSYLAIPNGLIRADEWPEGWGVLAYSESGIRRLRPPIPRHASMIQQLEIVLAIATRRDHNTRYARLRELQQGYRLENGERKTMYRASVIARAFMDIAKAKHGSVAETLDRHQLKNLGGGVMDDLQRLWGVAKPMEWPIPELRSSGT